MEAILPVRDIIIKVVSEGKHPKSILVSDLSSPVGTISGTCESCGNYSENLRPLDGKLLCDDCASQG